MMMYKISKEIFVREKGDLCFNINRLCGSVPGPEVIKLFSCSTLLSTKFILLINVKMPTIVGILIFIA